MRVLAILGALAAGLLSSVPALADQEVRNVRFGPDANRTRVVLEVTQEASFHAFTLDGLTSRLVVDMPTAAWSVEGLETGEGVGRGLVDSFRFFNNSATSSRIVFELEHPVVISSQFLLDPASDSQNHRIVVDIQRASEEDATYHSGFQPTSSGIDGLIAARVEAVYLPPQRERRVIVLDAGHGGHDPGAIGRGGTHESDVTLASARELRRQLEATGRYEVRMTRDRDIYPSWEDRVGVMADARADLFISLHADSSRNPDVRGAAIYTLNDRAEARARNRARAGADHSDQPDVNNILVELELREKRNQSSVFAQVMLDHLDDAGPLLTNPHREANFFVLLDPRVPAILLEMGFLSNSTDERNLNSDRFRRDQMASVVSGIDAYFSSRGDGDEDGTSANPSVRAR